MATFFWIAKSTPAGVIDIDGPFNTRVGRDDEFVKNNDFWAAAGINAVPFETEGRKLDEARALAVQILEQSAAPPSARAPAQFTQPTQSFEQSPKIQNRPTGIVDLAADENRKAHASHESFRDDPLSEENNNIDAALRAEVEAADSFEAETIAPERF